MELSGVHDEDAEAVFSVMKRGEHVGVGEHVGGGFPGGKVPSVEVGGDDVRYSVGEEIEDPLVAGADSQGDGVRGQSPQLSQSKDRLGELPRFPVERSVRAVEVEVPEGVSPLRILKLRHAAQFVKGDVLWIGEGIHNVHLKGIEGPQDGSDGPESEPLSASCGGEEDLVGTAPVQ